MKKLTLIIVLLVTPSIGLSEWERIGEDDDGTAYFTDFSKVVHHEPFVYYYIMKNTLEPVKSKLTEDLILSVILYSKASCQSGIVENIQYSEYKRQYGEQHLETMTFESGEEKRLPKKPEGQFLEAICN